jgi:hypothetical protein
LDCGFLLFPAVADVAFCRFFAGNVMVDVVLLWSSCGELRGKAGHFADILRWLKQDPF